MSKEKPEVWLSIPWMDKRTNKWGSYIIFPDDTFDHSDVKIGDTTIKVTKTGAQSFNTIIRVVKQDNDGVYCTTKKYRGIYANRNSGNIPVLSYAQLVDAQITADQKAFLKKLKAYLDQSQNVKDVSYRIKKVRKILDNLYIECCEYSMDHKNKN